METAVLVHSARCDQEHLIGKDHTTEDDVTFDRMEKIVEEFLKKWGQKNGARGGKPVHAVVEQPADEKERFLSLLNWQWCDYYGDYVITKGLNSAVKRARIEDTQDTADTADAHMEGREAQGGKRRIQRRDEPEEGSKGGLLELQRGPLPVSML